MGPFCGVVADALEFGFTLVAGHHGMEGAVLDLRLLEAEATCPACREAFSVDSMWDRCPRCDHAPVTVREGRELRIVEFEVNDV